MKDPFRTETQGLTDPATNTHPGDVLKGITGDDTNVPSDNMEVVDRVTTRVSSTSPLPSTYILTDSLTYLLTYPGPHHRV